MSGLMLAGFVIAFGFVTAAIVTNTVSWASGPDQAISVSFENVQSAIIGLLFLMVSGPYLVAENGIEYLKRDNVPVWVAITCLVVATCWSFCVGVLIVQALLGLGTLAA